MTQQRKNRVNHLIYFILCLILMISLNFALTEYILSNISVINDNFKLIDIVYVQNFGAAFSMFQHSTVLLVIISVLAVLFLLYVLLRNLNRYSMMFYFCSAMLISGIYCNTYERIVFGYVRDFFSLKFMHFPVFNISDILINLGVLAIMVLVITKKYLKND